MTLAAFLIRFHGTVTGFRRRVLFEGGNFDRSSKEDSNLLLGTHNQKLFSLDQDHSCLEGDEGFVFDGF